MFGLIYLRLNYNQQGQLRSIYYYVFILAINTYNQ
jgi:hypothetical protein